MRLCHKTGVKVETEKTSDFQKKREDNAQKKIRWDFGRA